jgi:hypothetical protein
MAILLKLQNKVLHTTGNLPRRIPTRDLHMAFKSLCLYDFITRPCRKQAAVILNHDVVNVHSIGQGEAQQRKEKDSSLVAVMHITECLDCGHILGQHMSIKHNLLYKIWADRPGVYTDTLYLKCRGRKRRRLRKKLNKNKKCL